jgi:hypothetical protein
MSSLLGNASVFFYNSSRLLLTAVLGCSPMHVCLVKYHQPDRSLRPVSGLTACFGQCVLQKFRHLFLTGNEVGACRVRLLELLSRHEVVILARELETLLQSCHSSSSFICKSCCSRLCLLRCRNMPAIGIDVTTSLRRLSRTIGCPKADVPVRGQRSTLLHCRVYAN